MQIKSILFGFGLGLVFLSGIFLITYRWESRDSFENQLVLEQAALLGMVWPTEDEAEVIRRALEIGMVFEYDVDMLELE